MRLLIDPFMFELSLAKDDDTFFKQMTVELFLEQICYHLILKC